MRKFTKEIAALMASAAIGTAAGAGAISASSEEIVTTAGVAMNTDAAICTTEEELPEFAGVPLPPDELVVTTTEEEIPPLAGAPTRLDQFIETITTSATTFTSITIPTTMPPLAGVPTVPDEWIKPTTTYETTITIPPLAGALTTTVPTTEELPPLMGDIAPADGDVNGDGLFNVADVVLFQKWLTNSSPTDLYYWPNADINNDGNIDVFDLIHMKRKLLDDIQTNPNPSSNSYTLSDIQAISADDISKVLLTVNLPGKTVQLTSEQIDEMLTLLKNVTVYEEDNSYGEYNGQWVEFDIILNDGQMISTAVYNPFFIVNRVGYKADYESCRELSAFANNIISE